MNSNKDFIESITLANGIVAGPYIEKTFNISLDLSMVLRPLIDKGHIEFVLDFIDRLCKFNTYYDQLDVIGMYGLQKLFAQKLTEGLNTYRTLGRADIDVRSAIHYLLVNAGHLSLKNGVSINSMGTASSVRYDDKIVKSRSRDGVIYLKLTNKYTYLLDEGHYWISIANAPCKRKGLEAGAIELPI